MPDTAEIRRRADGSIDTAHYIARARVCRSETAHRLAGTRARRARAPIGVIASLLALLPFMGGQG